MEPDARQFLTYHQALVVVDGIGAMLGINYADDESRQAIAARVALLDRLKAALLRQPVGLATRVPENTESEPGTDILTALREVRSTLTVVQAIGVCRLTLQEILDRLDAVIEEIRDAWSVDRPLARCRSLRPATPAEEGEVAALLRAGAGAGICWASDDDDGEGAA